jgi:tetratricopeptide (TPR) repeat protein
MHTNKIIEIYKTVLQLLMSGQLKSAFIQIKRLTNVAPNGAYSDRLAELDQNYSYLLHYYTTGVNDPQRKLVYNKLIAKSYVLLSELKEELLHLHSTNYEYDQKRHFLISKERISPNGLLEKLNYFHRQTEMMLNAEGNYEIELNRLRINYENNLSLCFKLFWLSTSFSADDKDLFNRLLADNHKGWIEKSLLVSALTLNLWRMFDEPKLMMLFDCCQSSNQQIKQRAMVGLCMVMEKYKPVLPFFPSVRNRLVLLSDDNRIVDNFQQIIIQLISTAETEKISKKLRDEIMPEVMKISPILKDKMDADSLMNPDEWEGEHPAWQEIIEKSGISEKIQELNEMQLEGADVYMSTFSMLKNFSFFNELSNWFIPFDTKNNAVVELFHTNDKSIIHAFINNNMMCNSDKYSFCLSVLQMPDSQRQMLKQNFQTESEQLSAIEKDEAVLKPNLFAKNISKQYIQDIFRFFKLHPQHEDFSDMFASPLTVHQSYLFDILSTDLEFNTTIAAYYFTKSHYSQALELFEKIIQKTEPTADLFQKMAYSYQQTAQIEHSLNAYSKADMLQPDDVWTIRKMALCERLLGNYEKALEYYQHADYLKPMQTDVLMQIANCYIELAKYKEALKIYFKLDAEQGDDPKIWRAITWCSFISWNIQKADYYAQKILGEQPTAHDYLNAGHIAWCQKRIGDVVELYQKCLAAQYNNWELFLESFNEDKFHLIANGVDADEIPLMLDVLRMQS